MYAEMQVTGRRPNSTGNLTQRSGKDGMQVVHDGHAHYYQHVYDGIVYTGANPQATPVTTQAGLSATTPAWTLYNPIGSGVNLVLLNTTLQVTTAPAAIVAFSLAFNLASAAAPTSVTLGNVTNNLIGNASSPKGQFYRVATLATAPVAFWYFSGVTAASLVAVGPVPFFLDGMFVVTPGVAISLQSTAAAAVIGSVTWGEVEI